MMRARNSSGPNTPYDDTYESIDTESPSKSQQPAKQRKQGGGGGGGMKRNEILLCLIVVVQFTYILMPEATMSMMKLRNRSKHPKVNIPSYQMPEYIEGKNDQQQGLVNRKWHSNGSPSINPELKMGSCWCSADDYCMCTPSLAIDTILTSGPEHFWLVKRKDAGKYATMGGFVEVGETSAEAVRRELQEEMNLDLSTFDELQSKDDKQKKKKKKKKAKKKSKQDNDHDESPHKGVVLEGVYSDPMRDHRRHTVSIVYSVEIPDGVTPKAGDDAAEVLRVHHDEIVNLDFFADHKTILMDYIARHKKDTNGGDANDSESEVKVDEDMNVFNSTIKRDVCVMNG